MLLLPILPVFIIRVNSATQSQTLYAHTETTTIGGSSYYLHLLSPADRNGTTLSASAATTGRKLMGRWVYPLSGIVSIPASTWTVTYRAMRSASASSVVAHGDVDILIRKADGAVRSTIAINAANSPSLTLINNWETLIGTYNWLGYTVADQTDYLEVDYYIEVTTPQSSKYVRLMVDNSALPLADQTKIENVVFTYPNQAPVASFTFSPSNPLIYDTVTFNASASYDPDGSIVSYKWDFGDGNTTTVTNPIITHVYTMSASTVNYIVTLTVTDNEGSTGLTTQIVPVTNPTILRVSLPDGTYVGPDPDHWLSQCWLLNITGLSETFTVRINNTAGGITSYNTHLIIALNNASYEYLNSLTVDATVIPKTSFVYGMPEPYGFTLIWEEGVYPTWYSDIYVVGTIDPKGYKDAQVSVSFFNATGIRTHFDAYGSTDSQLPPASKGNVTHNPHEYDSTVLFWPPAVVQYYLTVISPYGITGGSGWYDAGSTAYASLNTGLVDHGNETRRVFIRWNGDASGTNYANSDPITMNSPKTALAKWKTQYYVTVISPYGIPSGEGWYDNSSIIYVSLNTGVIDHGNDTRRIFSYWSGDGSGTNYSQSDPIHVDSPKTITAVWKTQFYLTVMSPYGSTSGQGWYDENSIAYAYLDIGTVDHGNGTRRVFTNWSGDASGINYAQSDPILMDRPKEAIAQWKTQYRLIMSTNFGTTSPSVGEHWYDAGSVVTILATDPSVIDGERYVWLGWTGTGTISYTGMDNPAPVTMNSPINQTAAWRHEYRLTMATNYGTTTPSVGQHWYLAGQAVSIQAFAPNLIYPGQERYVWNGWTGTGDGSYSTLSNPASVSMNGPITETASWGRQFLLTIKTSGLPSAYPTKVYLGGLQVGTASDALPYTKWFDSGAPTGTIGVDSIVSGATGTRYVFVKWVEDSSTINPRASETMNSPKIFTAGYKTQYQLTVRTSGLFVSTNVYNSTTILGTAHDASPYVGWVDANSALQLNIDSPITVDLTQYVFVQWSGDASGSTRPLSVTMNSSKDITANYETLYKITFAQTGVSADYPGIVVVIDSINYIRGALPVSFWWTKDSVHTFAFQSPLVVTANVKQYVWSSTSGLSSLQSGSITVIISGPVTGNYKTQYYFLVSSPLGSPTPTSGWFDEGTSITASVTSPWPGPAGTRYICTGWTGTGNVPASGTGTSVTFILTQPSSITWNWKTQYYLAARTDPSGIVTIPGEGWYDVLTNVPLTAPSVADYNFLYWDVDGVSQGDGVTSITVNMNAPHTATAHYTRPPAIPVGGRSVSLAKKTPTPPIVAYIALIALFGAALSLTKRKRK